MTLDALLYILKIIDDFKILEHKYFLEGNLPLNWKIRRLCIASGFIGYLDKKYSNAESNDNIMKIMYGDDVDPFSAQQVIDFSIHHLNQERSSKSKNIYRILIEMMNNTIDHAYADISNIYNIPISNEIPPNIRNKLSRWYLIAWHDTEEEEIKLAFLDGGLGIPVTLRKKGIDKILGLIKNVNDGLLNYSALDGQFRTRTLKKYRGKGLPTIYKSAQDEHIKNLKVFSNHGAVDCTFQQKHFLGTKFQGTLFTWDFN